MGTRGVQESHTVRDGTSRTPRRLGAPGHGDRQGLPRSMLDMARGRTGSIPGDPFQFVGRRPQHAGLLPDFELFRMAKGRDFVGPAGGPRPLLCLGGCRMFFSAVAAVCVDGGPASTSHCGGVASRCHSMSHRMASITRSPRNDASRAAERRRVRLKGSGSAPRAGLGSEGFGECCRIVSHRRGCASWVEAVGAGVDRQGRMPGERHERDAAVRG